MILLDTDHLNALKYPESVHYATLTFRMSASTDQDFATTVITVEEQMRGWLALINRTVEVQRQVPAYGELIRLFDFFARWHVVSFDNLAAEAFKRLRREGIRIGTMDLKIVSIALAKDALLLSANLRDFQQIPDLRVEDWMY